MIDGGIDETGPARFGSAKLDQLTVDAKRSGGIVLKQRAGHPRRWRRAPGQAEHAQR